MIIKIVYVKKKTNNNLFMNILISDDSEVCNLLLTYMLKSLNHNVTSTSNGKELLDTFIKNNGNYDLIITDISMPVMSGIEACQQITKFKDVPYILMSSDDALLIGNNMFIKNPFHLKMLKKH